MRSVCASRTLTICNSRRGFLWKKTRVRRSVHRAKFSCQGCAKLLKILLRRMAKRCQEEYEDVSEVLHPSTLSTLYMYVPRLNVCLVSAKPTSSSSICQTLSPLPYSLLRQCPFSLYRSLISHLCISHATVHASSSSLYPPF